MILENEAEPAEKQLGAARKVGAFLTQKFGMSPKDLPAGLRARFEQIGKKLELTIHFQGAVVLSVVLSESLQGSRRCSLFC